MAALRLDDPAASAATSGAQRLAPAAHPARRTDASRAARALDLNERRAVVVVNPVSAGGAAARPWRDALDRMRAACRFGEPIATSGDGQDLARVAAAIRAEEPEVVVAAGGDGTVAEVVRAMRDAGSDAALAIVPIGTANNVARTVGLKSVRGHGAAAVDAFLLALAGGAERRLDLATANGRPFVGALGAGMDADILAARHAWRRRLGRVGHKGGYSLYLLSCAVNVFRPHGAATTLAIDGAPARRPRHLYNLLVLNVPLYAAEFRFAAADPSDGCLDLVLFSGVADYLRRYPRAWRRHVRHERGQPVRAEDGVERFSDLVIEVATPVVWQIDGERTAPAARMHVRVLPSALRIVVPPETLPA